MEPGVKVVAYETKVILTLLAHQMARADNVREAYLALADAANAEGVHLPDYDDLRKRITEERAKHT
jgi:hypothetical protein